MGQLPVRTWAEPTCHLVTVTAAIQHLKLAEGRRCSTSAASRAVQIIRREGGNDERLAETAGSGLCRYLVASPAHARQSRRPGGVGSAQGTHLRCSEDRWAGS